VLSATRESWRVLPAGRTVRASTGSPQFLVTSDKSGGEAVHKPSALKNDIS
jgi:hypothetical protein